MSKRNSTWMVALIATTLAATIAAAGAQQQNQSQNQNSNQQQSQQAQPNQQGQPVQQTPTTQQNPQQKKSLWQKLRDASQASQNAIQQGSNTVQQGSSTVQQTTQQVQNGVQSMPNAAQQGASGIQGAASGLQSNGGTGACGSSCFDAGPFQANVSQMTTSQEGAWHVIRMTIQFHNSTDQPLVIAYHDGSMVMVDNNGNTYIPAGGNPGQLQGMGIDRGAQTDSQFQLGPGQTGTALFSVARNRSATSPIGTGYSYNLSIDQLQLQNGALALAVRTYNLNFPSLAPGTSNAAFGSVSAPASGFTGNGGSNHVVTSVPQGATQNVAGQSQSGAVAQPQRMVNGKPVTATPAQTTTSSTTNTQATKASVATTSHPATPTTTAKPIPATTAATPAAPAAKPPVTPAKKTTPVPPTPAK